MLFWLRVVEAPTKVTAEVPDTPPPAVLRSLTLVPDNVSLTVGGTQTFSATGTYSDGHTSLDSGVVWGTNGASVTVNAGTGLATAVTPGTVTVTANVGGIIGLASVSVAAAPAVVCLTNQWHPILPHLGGPQRQLVGWGWNRNGQLGDATLADKVTPVRIGSDNTWSQVAAGEYHSLGLKSDGTLWAWGLNGNGQMGTGTQVALSVPTEVGTDTTCVAIAAGKNHSLASWMARCGLGDGTLTAGRVGHQCGPEHSHARAQAPHGNRCQQGQMALQVDGSLWAGV